MARKKESAALGVKYGFTIRERYMQVIKKRRARYACPRCSTGILKRLSVGVWRCRKCAYTFAGGAYEPITKAGEAATRAVVSTSRSG
ncbi:MAG: 50S ribosomal protein L37ae [Thermoproteota archaeon]